MSRHPLAEPPIPIRAAATEPLFGPSDSSDSSSDVAGAERDTADPALPLDAALDDDAQRPLVSPEGLRSGSSDAAGTGERRSAADDAGERDDADIGTDRVFDLAEVAAEAAADEVEPDEAELAAAAPDDPERVVDDTGDDDDDDDGGDAAPDAR